MGRLGLPRGFDRHNPDLRPAQRPLRAPAGPPRRDWAVSWRLGAVRFVADHAAADWSTGSARHRRRRLALGVAGGDRRCHPAARAGPLPGLFFERHGGLEPARSRARWVLRRLPELALDLLDQYPVRPVGAFSLQPQSAAPSDAAFIVPLFVKCLETLEVGLPARCDTDDLFAQSRQPPLPVSGRRRGFGTEHPAQPARQGGCRS